MGIRRAAALFLATVVPGAAHAQAFGPLLGSEIPFNTVLGNNVGVVDRKRPEVEPLGIRSGGFLIFPQIGLGAGYTSNVYGSSIDKKGDAFFTIEPRVELRSDWSRHSFDLVADGAIKRFASQTPKDETGYSVTANGRIDITDNDHIEMIANSERGYEQQNSGSFPTNAAGSVEYDRLTALLRGTAVINRFRIIGSGDINTFNFHDTPALSGAIFDEDFRDRVVSRGSGRVEFALTPATALFAQGSFSHSDYTKFRDGIAKRSNDEVRVIGGLTFDVTAVIRANIGLGYVRRTYDAPVYGNIASVAADIQISYFVDALTTVTFDARRDVQDATFSISPGFISSRGTLRADHELLRNLLPFVEAQYERDDYKAIDRNDNYYSIRAGATYLTNRYVKIEPEISYAKRSSSGTITGSRFDEVRGMVKITFQR